jgi:hypothetical protein
MTILNPNVKVRCNILGSRSGDYEEFWDTTPWSLLKINGQLTFSVLHKVVSHNIEFSRDPARERRKLL